MKRLEALDGLRGVLACVVVACHVALAFRADMSWVAAFSVLTFFAMSSFVLGRAYSGRYWVFLGRRFVRLWPLYAVCILAGSALAGAWPSLRALTWTGFPDADVPGWSLMVEAWATPLLPALFWLGRKNRMALVVLTGLACCAIHYDQRAVVLAAFLAGASLAQFDVKFPERVPAPIVFLGRVSFSLYLTHQVVFDAYERVFGPWGAVVALPVVAVVALLAWVWVEVPSIAWSRRVGRVKSELPDSNARYSNVAGTGFARVKN
jgi:peptidoglycan/LPS O-acetylase OafA/YrhL